MNRNPNRRHLLHVLPLSGLFAAGCAAPPPAPPAAATAPPAATAPSPQAARTAAGAPPGAALATLAPTGLSPQDANAITAHHNKVRADVGVGPLRWSPGLAAYAQQWAGHLATSDCQMVHRSPNTYGENLFQGTFGAYTAVDAAKAWESEKKDYDGRALNDANWSRAGHYTQMVWRETQQLGCGQAICRGTLIVACNYDPPGNFMGRKPY